MSEVKSARELASTIWDKLYENGRSIDGANLAEIIKSDHRAIIEKCKGLVMADSETHTMIRCDYVCELLDSVLSEMGKEE